MHHVLEFNQWLKQYVEFNTHQKKKKTEAEKNGDKDEKALHKLMNNTVYRKTIKNLRNRMNVKLVSKKILFKMDIQTKLHTTQNN